ncbi:MAG TPA: SlyX family protein [Nevskiaceae bacterium]
MNAPHPVRSAAPAGQTAAAERRVVELESRLAFVDQAAETLSRALAAQQSRIDRLERLCGDLAERVRQLSDADPHTPAEEVPPHY